MCPSEITKDFGIAMIHGHDRGHIGARLWLKLTLQPGIVEPSDMCSGE